MYADDDKRYHFPDRVKIADMHFFMKKNVCFLLVSQCWNQIDPWPEDTCHAGETVRKPLRGDNRILNVGLSPKQS